MNCALPRIEPLDSQTGVPRFHEDRYACLCITPTLILTPQGGGDLRNNTNLLPQGKEIGNNLNPHFPLPWRERVRVRGNNPNNIGSNQFDLLYNINFNYNGSIG